MDIEEYKKRLKKNENVKDAELRKQFYIEPISKSTETADGTEVPFVISTGSVDRDQDTIAITGWQLDNYRKNPVVLWAHDSRQPPVAKSSIEWIQDERLKSTALFTPKDLNPFGYMIGQMYIKGFLNAVSVGFRSLEAKWAADEETRPWGIDYFKQELLEYSCCPVPANPDALTDAKSAGIDLEPLLDWSIKVLDEGIMITREKAEKIYGILSRKSTFLVPKPPEKPPENGNKTSIKLIENQIKINQNWR
jgi:HK97 family phage prohead protease